MVGLAPSATGRVDEFGAENPGMFLVSLTVRLTATDAPAEALDVNVADLRTRSDREMVTVNDHAHRKARSGNEIRRDVIGRGFSATE